ncbi:MAG: ferrochelatase [Actinomycetota bacterium]
MIAVLLLGFGGPECLEEVGPFIERITGRELPPERLAEAVEKYRLIGGGSPLCGVSRKQAALLERTLRQDGLEAKVYLGMRYWNPGISEAAGEAAADKPDRIVAICLTPYFSHMSAGEYLRAASAAVKEAGIVAALEIVEDWHAEPDLITAFAASLKGTMAGAGDDFRVLFTAHSIPKSMVDAGDPYAARIAETVDLIAKTAGLDKWLFGWQSEGHGRGEWLKPTAEEMLAEVKADGASAVIVAPIGFISDHVETLYDLDIVLKRQAHDLGLDYFRVRGLNDNEMLAKAMASAVKKRLRDGGTPS